MAIKLPKKGHIPTFEAMEKAYQLNVLRWEQRLSGATPTLHEIRKAYEEESIQDRFSHDFEMALSPDPARLNDELQVVRIQWLQMWISDCIGQVTKAIDMVKLFSDQLAENDALEDWLNAERDSLTVADMQGIVRFSMFQGLREAMRQKQAQRTESRTTKEEKIRQEWQKLKAKGASKNSVSKTIADKVGLADRTVRKKLQKM